MESQMHHTCIIMYTPSRHIRHVELKLPIHALTVRNVLYSKMRVAETEIITQIALLTSHSCIAP